LKTRFGAAARTFRAANACFSTLLAALCFGQKIFE
jgi:hypothetical protein